MVKSSETLPPSAILPPVSANINRVPIRRYDQYGSANLCALRVLIVEGDYLQARALTTFLRNTGAVVVGPAPTLSRGLLEVEFHEPTFAVLDIQLGENLVFPLADRLHAGSIPYVFFSAPFQDIPARFSKVRRIEKAHGFDHLLSEIIVEQARDRAGLGSEQYGSAMTLDDALPLFRHMARGLVGDRDAADNIVAHALERALLIADKGFRAENRVALLTNLIELVWRDQRMGWREWHWQASDGVS